MAAMGKKARDSDRLPLEVEKKFPNLTPAVYCVSSPYDTSHNCVAYAVGDYARKWDPSMVPLPGYYWPSAAPRSLNLSALVSVFESIGYEVCDGGDLEPGYEKIAVYGDEYGDWTHAAKQEPSEQWSSKLGNREDIRHRTPHCFIGSDYGHVFHFMRRRIQEVA